MNQNADGRAFLNIEEDSESISSNEPLPDEVPLQLADTPGPFLKSLGLEPPIPPAATSRSDTPKPRASDNPKPRASGGQPKKKKTSSTGQNPQSARSTKEATPTRKRKPAPDPKMWVPLAYRERKKDDFIYFFK